MWKFTLKDGREVIIRPLKVGDKDGLFQMFSLMSDEALMWSMAPYTMEVIERWMSNLKNLIVLVAEWNNRIVDYAMIYKFLHPRRRGVGDLALYVHQDFHNVGLGTAMLKKLLQLAQKEGMHKIELYVVEDDIVAIHLYKKSASKLKE